jgi:hypothetical protein
MIVALTTGPHRYTFKSVQSERRVRLRVMAYERALLTSRLPRATYLFTDFDRLDHHALELAAHLYQSIVRQGGRAINDPARARQRFSLLRTLHDRGLNRFDVWRVEDTPRPDRFPVFLRRESGHSGVISDLLHDAREVESAITHAIASGCPRRELILVEYAAEPSESGWFRKYSAYRVGDRMVPALCVHDTRWVAKLGQEGLAGEAAYADELDMIRTNRFADLIRPSFEAADLEFGRADFGIVGGSPQVYEINTNPTIKPLRQHPYKIRLESARLVEEQLIDALVAIDSPRGRPFTLDDELLTRHQRRARWLPFLPI